MSEFGKEKLRTLTLEAHDAFDDETDELDVESEEIEIDTELFAEHLSRFPCFRDAPHDAPSDELFDKVFTAYQDENLTEEQDHVVECLLHLQEEDSPFNLNRAFEVWSREDRQAFIRLLGELDTLIEEA